MRTLSERYADLIAHGGGGQTGAQFFPEAEEQGIENAETLVHSRAIPRVGLGDSVEVRTVIVETNQEVKE